MRAWTASFGELEHEVRARTGVSSTGQQFNIGAASDSTSRVVVFCCCCCLFFCVVFFSPLSYACSTTTRDTGQVDVRTTGMSQPMLSLYVCAVRL